MPARSLLATALLTPMAAAGILGCSSSPTAAVVNPPSQPTAKAKFVYTGNQGYAMSGTVYPSLSGYSVDTSTGALTPLPGFPYAIGENPTIITHDPLNRFLLVGDIADAKLHVLAINSNTGALTEVSPSPYATFAEPVSIAVDPTATHVYVASQDVGQVAAYDLASTGVLTAVAGSPFTTSTDSNSFSIGAGSLFTDAKGKFLYVQDLHNLYTFGVDSSSGALTLIQTIAGPNGGTGIALDPSGSYVYAVGAGASSVSSYSLNASNGMLTLTKTSPMLEQKGAYTITVSPTGQFAYTIENNNDLVSYSVHDGALAAVGTGISSVFGQQIGIDPTGSFLYVPQACSNCPSGLYDLVNEFTIGTSGAVMTISGSPVAAGITPYGITITTQ